MIDLRCWHCRAPIGTQSRICSNCGAYLDDREAGAIVYEVVGGALAGSRPRGLTPALTGGRTRRSGGGSGGGRLARYWRGEIELDISFWAVTVLGWFIVVLTPILAFRLVVALTPSISMVEYVDFGGKAFLVSLILLGPVSVWMVVGAWRSATRWDAESPRPGWAIPAKILLALYLLAAFAGGVMATISLLSW